LEATVVQPIYLEPFPTWEFEKFKNVNPIVVEQSVMGAFETLIKEKTGIKLKLPLGNTTEDPLIQKNSPSK